MVEHDFSRPLTLDEVETAMRKNTYERGVQVRVVAELAQDAAEKRVVYERTAAAAREHVRHSPTATGRKATEQEIKDRATVTCFEVEKEAVVAEAAYKAGERLLSHLRQKGDELRTLVANARSIERAQ